MAEQKQSELAKHPLEAGGKNGQSRFAVILNGTRTEIVLTPFVDTVSVIITQRNNLGSVLVAHRENQPMGGGEEEGAASYNITTRLGVRDELNELLCRRLIHSLGCPSLTLMLAWASPSQPPSLAELKALVNCIAAKKAPTNTTEGKDSLSMHVST